MCFRICGLFKKQDNETHIYPLDLNIEKGEWIVLLGEAGAGKTTLMRLLTGLERPTSGQLFEDDKDLTHISVQKRSVAMVYQQFINYPNLTVFENIASPMRVAGINSKIIEEKVEKYRYIVSLPKSTLSRLPLELSGGQQQRVAIARAMAKEANLVLLDEPLANLDYKLREELREELPIIFEQTGSTVVYSTAEAQEALIMGGRTVLMHQGRLEGCKEALELYRNPPSKIAADIYSPVPMNFMRLELCGQNININNQSFKKPSIFSKIPHGSYDLGIHPHHLQLHKTPQVDALEVLVIDSQYTGCETYVHFQTQQGKMMALIDDFIKVSARQKLFIRLDFSASYLFDIKYGKTVFSPFQKRGCRG